MRMTKQKAVALMLEQLAYVTGTPVSKVKESMGAGGLAIDSLQAVALIGWAEGFLGIEKVPLAGLDRQCLTTAQGVMACVVSHSGGLLEGDD